MQTVQDFLLLIRTIWDAGANSGKRLMSAEAMEYCWCDFSFFLFCFRLLAPYLHSKKPPCLNCKKIIDVYLGSCWLCLLLTWVIFRAIQLQTRSHKAGPVFSTQQTDTLKSRELENNTRILQFGFQAICLPNQSPCVPIFARSFNSFGAHRFARLSLALENDISLHAAMLHFVHPCLRRAKLASLHH